jgi:uncharacterized protein (TIGR03000 family)
MYGYAPEVEDYSSYYPPAAGDVVQPPVPQSATPAQQDNAAHLMVYVPANAQLWFNGTPTQLTGTQREFFSPPLTPGQMYHYEIRARWMENGRPVDVTRTVAVQANDWKEIDMTSQAPPSGSTIPPPAPTQPLPKAPNSR